MKANRDWLFVLLSLIIQISLGIFLGHYYDVRVSMASGYLVSSGLNPYVQYNFAEIFSHPLIAGIIPSIGYPPPWSLLVGAIFRLSYDLTSNIYLYNFAIKVPIILGNLGLAYLVRHIILKTQANQKWARDAWLFILFNPFILLSSAAWGGFDTLVALLCCASLYFCFINKPKSSATLMAIGITLKPIALPLAGLPLLVSWRKKRRILQYLLVFSVVFLVSFFGPFYVFGWNLPLGSNEWNAHFKMAGGLSPFGILELFEAPVLPSGLEFLGFLWVPALVIGYYLVYRNPPNSLGDLIRKAVGLLLIFFLLRSWLSEPNLNLVLSLLLIAVEPGKRNCKTFHFMWAIPLLFMFFNFSFPQLFFLPFPAVLDSLAAFDEQAGSLRLIARFIITILWQIFAWTLTAKLIKR